MGQPEQGETMPIYEYRCTDCRHEFESLQKISDAPVSTCPKCGEKEVKKLVSQSGFVLKGGGWYKDHYGLKSSDTSTSSSSESSSAEPVSDSAPASTTASTE